MADKAQQPRNIFEQIALGLRVTNENTVAIAADLAELFRLTQEIHRALFPVIETPSEPNASGAEQVQQ